MPTSRPNSSDSNKMRWANDSGVKQYLFAGKSPMMTFEEVFVSHLRLLACALLLAATCFAVPSAPQAEDRAAINEAVNWIRATPGIRAEYDYIMTCCLRLLVFWVGRDDLMKFAKYSDTSGVAPASCRHRRMPPGRRRYDEGLSPYFANISRWRIHQGRPN